MTTPGAPSIRLVSGEWVGYEAAKPARSSRSPIVDCLSKRGRRGDRVEESEVAFSSPITNTTRSVRIDGHTPRTGLRRENLPQADLPVLIRNEYRYASPETSFRTTSSMRSRVNSSAVGAVDGPEGVELNFFTCYILFYFLIGI